MPTVRRGILLVLAAMIGCGAEDPTLSPAEAARLEGVTATGEKLRPLHVRNGPAAKGEWMADHPEDGQTFAEYRDTLPNRPDAQHTTLYVQPIGIFPGKRKELLDRTVEVLGLFYGLPVKTLAPIEMSLLPESAHRLHPTTGRPQVDSLSILDLLRKRRPDDAVAILALTASDLWPKGDRRIKNFVFGQASLGDRVGVWSIARLGDPDREFPICLKRTIQVALHETGHMFGMHHCTAYECGMNGSNSLWESDRQPTAFCAECEMKVWWSLNIDPRARFTPLAGFAEAQGLDDAAKAWNAAGRAVGSK
jgi:archaemetzincin